MLTKMLRPHSATLRARDRQVPATLPAASPGPQRCELDRNMARGGAAGGERRRWQDGRVVRGGGRKCWSGRCRGQWGSSGAMAGNVARAGDDVAGPRCCGPQHACDIVAGPQHFGGQAACRARPSCGPEKNLGRRRSRQRCRQHRLLMLHGHGRRQAVRGPRCRVGGGGHQPCGPGRVRGWAMVEPALAGMASPVEAVRSCRAATPAAAAAAVLGALLRHAGEPLAARAVLQAVVPALRTLAAPRRRGLPPAHPTRPGKQATTSRPMSSRSRYGVSPHWRTHRRRGQPRPSASRSG